MSNDKRDHLYSARWGLTRAIDNEDYGEILDYVVKQIYAAKAGDITAVLEEEPDRPTEPHVPSTYNIPKIVRVPGIKFKKRGSFNTKSGKPEGLLVHYTVSGGTASSAKGVLGSLARRRLGCPVMAHDGTIYIPEDYDMFGDVVYHAGKSYWGGKSSMSQYLMGIEICNWGRLSTKTRAYAKHIRKVPADNMNMVHGDYEMYTPEQELCLKNLVLWMQDVLPDFKIANLCGHDEVSPGRKFDPGAALSLPMPKYRELFSK